MKFSESQCWKVLKHKHVSSLYRSVLKRSSLINQSVSTHSWCPRWLLVWLCSGELKEDGFCGGPFQMRPPPRLWPQVFWTPVSIAHVKICDGLKDSSQSLPWALGSNRALLVAKGALSGLLCPYQKGVSTHRPQMLPAQRPYIQGKRAMRALYPSAGSPPLFLLPHPWP